MLLLNKAKALVRRDTPFIDESNSLLFLLRYLLVIWIPKLIKISLMITISVIILVNVTAKTIICYNHSENPANNSFSNSLVTSLL